MGVIGPDSAGHCPVTASLVIEMRPESLSDGHDDEGASDQEVARAVGDTQDVDLMHAYTVAAHDGPPKAQPLGDQTHDLLALGPGGGPPSSQCPSRNRPEGPRSGRGGSLLSEGSRAGSRL